MPVAMNFDNLLEPGSREGKGRPTSNLSKPVALNSGDVPAFISSKGMDTPEPFEIILDRALGEFVLRQTEESLPFADPYMVLEVSAKFNNVTIVFEFTDISETNRALSG